MTSDQTHFSAIKTVLVANRGEIACRIIRTCKQYGIKSVVVFSNEDAESLHVSEADESILLTGTGVAAYTDIPQIVKAAQDCKADAVIPGYGFLSENRDFVAALEAAGIIFVGPASASVELFGLKHSARELAVAAGVPVVPGSGLITSESEALEEAAKIGFPVILKATAGGGGMGMKVCRSEEEVVAGVREVRSRGSTLFKNDGLFMERYVEHGRHIEVQVFGNGAGDVVAFGERECSVQRRHQKVVEETPSPFIAGPAAIRPELRAGLSDCAARLAAAVKYKSAGTIEFLVDDDDASFYFLEMNTRLQVEHGVTELVYGVDLVYLMLLQAEYERRGTTGIPEAELRAAGTFTRDSAGRAVPEGHSIEVRLYAENPVQDFRPCPGVLTYVSFPDSLPDLPQVKVRVDTWVATGTSVTPHFDPLLAKLLVWAPTRAEAVTGMLRVLQETSVHGPTTNAEYLAAILDSQEFRSGKTLTSFLNNFKFTPKLMEFTIPGAYTTVQDLPGRITYNGGVLMGGPMDKFAFQAGNLLVGNPPETEGFEIVLLGPEIKFHAPATISLCGGDFAFTIDGKEMPLWAAVDVPAGSVVKIGELKSGVAGKCYLAIRGGLPSVAEYLGSKATSPTVHLGGHQGGPLRPGDCLAVADHEPVEKVSIVYQLPDAAHPDYNKSDEEHVWWLRCLHGPHDTPEIIGDEGHKTLFETEWKVNMNSNRGSLTLDGPKVPFARPDGRDGGNHPANIIEYIFPPNGVSTVGDMTVISAVDGITVSGFLSPIVPIEADWWKFGQAKVGAKIRFNPVTYNDALKLRKRRQEYLQFIGTLPTAEQAAARPFAASEVLESYEPVKVDSALYAREAASSSLPQMMIRQAGEKMIQVDFGLEKFALASVGRQYLLCSALEKLIKEQPELAGVYRMETSNGCLAIAFEPATTSREHLLKTVIELEASLPPTEEMKVPSRLFRLPLCIEHPAVLDCWDRYAKSIRPTAAYLPNNREYLMKSSLINTFEEFKARACGPVQVITAVSFICCTPLMVHKDPRLSFKSGKYNPSRHYTPAGAVGTGSVSQSIHPIETPGGYMIWGLTLPSVLWNTFARLEQFKQFGNMPWYLRTFDQIQFYEVEADELDELERKMKTNRFVIKPEECEIDFGEYTKFLAGIEDEVTELRARQDAMGAKLKAEDDILKAQWEAEKAQLAAARAEAGEHVDADALKCESTMTASVFKIPVQKGDRFKSDDVVVILEAMKTEIPIRIQGAVPGAEYEVKEVLVGEKDVVNAGQVLLVYDKVE